MDFIFGIFATAFQAIWSVLWFILLFIGLLIFIYFKHRQDEERTLPALDTIDAKKLDDMVVRQAEAALKPILSSKGYAHEQIAEILTRNSNRGQSFKR